MERTVTGARRIWAAALHTEHELALPDMPMGLGQARAFFHIRTSADTTTFSRVHLSPTEGTKVASVSNNLALQDISERRNVRVHARDFPCKYESPNCLSPSLILVTTDCVGRRGLEASVLSSKLMTLDLGRDSCLPYSDRSNKLAMWQVEV